MKKSILYTALLGFLFSFTGCTKIKFTGDNLAGNWKYSEFQFIHFQDTFAIDTTIYESGYFNFTAIEDNQSFIGNGTAKIPLFYDVWDPAFFGFRPAMHEGPFALQRSGNSNQEKYNKRNAYLTTIDIAATQNRFKMQLIDKNHLVIIIPYAGDVMAYDPDNFIYARINLTK